MKRPQRPACPHCGTRTERGFCARCDAWTGLCAAGRGDLAVSPSVIDPAVPREWRRGCTALGTVPVVISASGEQYRRLVCKPHAEEIDGKRAPWAQDPRARGQVRLA